MVSSEMPSTVLQLLMPRPTLKLSPRSTPRSRMGLPLVQRKAWFRDVARQVGVADDAAHIVDRESEVSAAITGAAQATKIGGFVCDPEKSVQREEVGERGYREPLAKPGSDASVDLADLYSHF
jgi:hypothetical protein